MFKNLSTTLKNVDFKPFLTLLKTFTVTLVIVVAVFVTLWLAGFRAWTVSGSSMWPTFSDGDIIIGQTINDKANKVNNGDIIVFAWPDNLKRNIVKRVISVGKSDNILIGRNGRLYDKTTKRVLDDKERKYGNNVTICRLFNKHVLTEFKTLRVPNKHFLVRGDNVNNSWDSRSRICSPDSKNLSHYVPQQDIKGRVLFNIPLGKLADFAKK